MPRGNCRIGLQLHVAAQSWSAGRSECICSWYWTTRDLVVVCVSSTLMVIGVTRNRDILPQVVGCTCAQSWQGIDELADAAVVR